MVYIVGVDHLVQYDGPVSEVLRKEFEQYLEDSVKKYKITLIAEEFSRESLVDVYSAKECSARNAANRCGIEHRYCDPEEKEREALGIPYYFDVRETVKDRYNARDKLIIDNNIQKMIEDKTRGIVKSYWHIRERFWVDRIIDRIDENILFICGHEHAERLSKLLEDMGYASIINDSFWHSDMFGNYQNIGLS